jgi:hypothetical protein
MLKNKLLSVFFAALFMIFFSYNAIVWAEEAQGEEFFSQPIQELTGKIRNVPVYSHIYGANFMNEQERCSYLLKLDGMKTKEERSAFQSKHRQEIDMRRKEAGG